MRRRVPVGMRRAALVSSIVGTALAFIPLAAVVAPPAGAAPVCTGTPTVTCTFAFTGASDTFTVPAGVTQITFDAFGAQGGTSQFNSTAGGLGGEATATISVTSGEVLQFNVGGQPPTEQNAPGGFNGGGGTGINSTSGNGGGGGGGSDVRGPGFALADRIVVAGGGGGGAGLGTSGPCTGGSGGGTNGGDGATCNGLNGLGGTPIVGGDGSGFGGTMGGAGQGGNGGNAAVFGGAGGGGGLFGGGGGAGGGFANQGGGGGGGSGLTPLGTGLTNAVRAGDGVIVITFTPGSSVVPANPAAAVTATPAFTG